jgi:hypothetical protein
MIHLITLIYKLFIWQNYKQNKNLVTNEENCQQHRTDRGLLLCVKKNAQINKRKSLNNETE